MSTETKSLRTAYAKHILNHQVLKTLNKTNKTLYGALPRAPELPEDSDKPYEGRICIIGAGAAGLYTAMMLKFLGITNVDILEASDRVGGRLYTQSLSGGDDYHNYYDVGAMRIPDIAWMKHVLDFIDLLGLTSSRQEYVYKNDDVPSSYYYRSKPAVDPKFEEFMDQLVGGFTQSFGPAFAEWLTTTNNDNYSTRSFLMAGPQDPKCPKHSAPIP
ncbi:hypothetical protein A1O7_02000 [Cladophialophora yegresii CBS 114405]|uniref:Amine oxidase domain-containing protein n=1 Tax=Cladophialophora yegresii CBS 114405 TaxID=1182544 RepID=W9W0F7_9EURO|nr:uncharacterized protein A1O7_02000 [Cladophialophora yegresii CBS 114405]EXJ61572.1 hypothetical protein A1O7_02000 [Cladophialophora yegresii CBS 114405]